MSINRNQNRYLIGVVKYNRRSNPNVNNRMEKRIVRKMSVPVSPAPLRQRIRAWLILFRIGLWMEGDIVLRDLRFQAFITAPVRPLDA